ncbi:MAG TPA: ABC transporter permease [Bryobacteraceae bacterium]|nr:ABC transporter permease [Bryobacteraceae bacterium]
MKQAAGGPSRAVAVTLRVYRALARAFPQEFRNIYGDELLQMAEDAAEPTWRSHGAAGLARLLLDIAIRVPAEYLAELRQDVRHGLRAIAGAPGFAAVALTSLSLGICIAVCAYSEMNGLLRDLPDVPNPQQLAALQGPVSYPTYQRYRQLQGVFSASFAYLAPVPFGISTGARTERTWGHLVTASYFSTLGMRPFLGRFFDEADEQPGRAPVAVISYRFWEEHLGSDPSVVGTALRINGQPCTVIGVGRKKFLGASPALFVADLWLPVSVDAHIAPELANHALERRDLPIFHMAGRLRPGVTQPAAEAELSAVSKQLAEFYGDPERDRKDLRVRLLEGGKILPLRKQDIPFFREFLLLLGGLILLIACANVANMMLARAADRRREIAVRLALGASRARLIRQLLTESLLLAVGAAIPAFPLCLWLMHLLSQLRMPFPIPVAFDLTPDWRALGFTFAVTCVAGLAFGLAPAWRATRPDLVSALKEGGNALLHKYRILSLRNGLVLCQMAASLMLLLITGYMGLGIQSTLGVQEGFDPRNLYLISLDPVRDGYSPARTEAFFEKLLDRLKTRPAVASVCLTDTLPVAWDGNPGVWFSRVDRPRDTSRNAYWARRHIVGRDYFETAGIQILAGRSFRKQDQTEHAAAVIVSQQAVRQFWKGEDPVGQWIEIRNGEASGGFGAMPGTIDHRSTVLAKEIRRFQVVGVARDVTEDFVANKKPAAVYFPLRPADYAQPSLRGVTLLVRAAPGVDAIRVVRGEISAMDSAITPFHGRSMSEHIAQFMSALQGASWTYGLLGLFGLILASVGVAGVTAHSVVRRAHEIGIRMALGAQKRDVLKLVMKEGAGLVTVGTVAGMAFAWVGIRALSGMFFTVASVKSSEPAVLAGGPLLLAGVALIACYLPARRSMRIDPAITLRME